MSNVTLIVDWVCYCDCESSHTCILQYSGERNSGASRLLGPGLPGLGFVFLNVILEKNHLRLLWWSPGGDLVPFVWEGMLVFFCVWQTDSPLSPFIEKCVGPTWHVGGGLHTTELVIRHDLLVFIWDIPPRPFHVPSSPWKYFDTTTGSLEMVLFAS